MKSEEEKKKRAQNHNKTSKPEASFNMEQGQKKGIYKLIIEENWKIAG